MAGEALPARHPHHGHLPRPRAPARPREPPSLHHPRPAPWLAGRCSELDAGNIDAIITAARQYPLAGIKAEELDKKLGYFERNAPPDALPALPSPRHVHRLRRHRRRNQGDRRSSAPSSQACTGPPRAPPASSPCAASTPAAGGTSSGQPAPPRQPGCAPPSDRQQDSDTQATAATKIISNKAGVHPDAADGRRHDRVDMHERLL